MSLDLTTFHHQTRDARKVMIVSMGYLGDCVLLIPALWEVRRNYPHAELHVGATPLGCEVLHLVPCVDCAWALKPNPSHATWQYYWRLARALRREHLDLAINLSSSDRTILWTALTGARQRAAHTGPRTPFWRTWLIPRWVPRQAPALPVAQQHLNVLAALGLSVGKPRWDVSLPDAAVRRAESLVPQGAIHISPCASAPLKEWPLEHWIELIRRLLARDPQQQIVVTGGLQAREQERLRQLVHAVASERLTVPADLRVAELAAGLRRCRLHVGADSGALHLALLAGLPTVALFRDYHDAAAWIPAGPAHRVLRAPCVCVNRPFQPCARAGRAECLAGIAVRDVEAAVLDRLATH